jgi:hypothetical protein
MMETNNVREAHSVVTRFVNTKSQQHLRKTTNEKWEKKTPAEKANIDVSFLTVYANQFINIHYLILSCVLVDEA